MSSVVAHLNKMMKSPGDLHFHDLPGNVDKLLTTLEWTSATASIDGQELLAVRFLDLQEKQFITNASTSLPGPPRATKVNIQDFLQVFHE